MIVLHTNKAQYVSYGKELFTVILEGEFKGIDHKEYRFVTCNPANLLVGEGYEYETFSYRLILREKQIVKKWFFFEREETVEYTIQLYSINSMMNYVYTLPAYNSNLCGEFVYEMVITKANYKKYIFKQELKQLLNE